ncbi:DUF6777 domain-containing protein [Kitasatospora sp. NPDC056184]|uniref:DUF6777 domain-containing protein n=1 Tax=Kitasatospora sp. NPDC056184 TaxID=3345738 RepID=UPI0035DDFCB5
MAAGATVLIVNTAGGGGGHEETVPTANEVALQSPQDPGPAPFTQTVETQAMQATVTTPAPTTAPATAHTPAHTGPAATPTGGAAATAPATAALHAVEGTSAGVYGGTMSQPSCDVERLVSMTSTGDTGRAWASAEGIEQSALPGYLRSLTSAYLRVDTRVTSHGYKGGAAVGYQAVLAAGTAVMVDTQGVPRVRCSCGNPLKPPTLVSEAKYTGKAWTGFQPSTLVVLTPAPQPVTAIVLVNVTTGGWFTRATGKAEIVDRPAPAPTGPLAPGVPPPSIWKPAPKGASVSASASPSASGSTSTSWSPTGPTTTSTSPYSESATASTPGTTSPGPSTPGQTTPGQTTPGATTSTPSGPTTPAPTTPVPTTPAETTAVTPTVTATSTPAVTTTTAESAPGTTTAAGTATATPATTTSVETPATAPGTPG